MPNGNGIGRTLLGAIIAAAIAALLVPSISAIIVVAQMHERQGNNERRLLERMDALEGRFIDHGTKPAHGMVGERLTEHDTKFEGQGKTDADQNRRLELVERFASDFYEQKVHFRILERRVNSFHKDEVHR